MFDTIDAAIFNPIDRHYYFFKASNYIRYQPEAGVVPFQNGDNIGTLGVDGWQELPDEFRDRVDTCFIYENGNIFFLKDNLYAEWDTEVDRLVKTGERKVFHIGVNKWTTFPASFLNGIDAAFYCVYDECCYFFKGNEFIQAKQATGVIRNQGKFRQNISVHHWEGLPLPFCSDIDAVLPCPDNKLIFFKGREYLIWVPGLGVAPNYPRTLGKPHLNNQGWPGLASLLAGPLCSGVSSSSARIWCWFNSQVDAQQLKFTLNKKPITPEFTPVNIPTIEMGDLQASIDTVQENSYINECKLMGLNDNCQYQLDIFQPRHDQNELIESIQFKTAPPAYSAQTIKLILGSCVDTTQKASLPIYQAIAAEQPDLLILAGNSCCYYDAHQHTTSCQYAQSPTDWSSTSRMLSRQLEVRNHPDFQAIMRQLPIISTWGAHDFAFAHASAKSELNSLWVGREQSAMVFRSMWPQCYQQDHSLYYDFHWGPLHIFMTDSYYFKQHSHPHEFLGKEQLYWLISGLKKSESPLKIVVFSEQALHKWTDMHLAGLAQEAKKEHQLLLQSLALQQDNKVLFLTGNQYFSECSFYPTSGCSNIANILEVASSPLALNGRHFSYGHRSYHVKRLWQSAVESFAVITIKINTADSTVVKNGHLTVELLDKHQQPVKDNSDHHSDVKETSFCRVKWDLATGKME